MSSPKALDEALHPSPAPVRPAPRRLATADFVVGESSRRLRALAFPDATDSEWNDWRWQVRNRIRDLASLERILRLTDDERAAIQRHRGTLPVGINPYYAGLLSPDDPRQPLRITAVPVSAEYERSPDEGDDPLSEDSHTPVPGIVHRYPDRVLFLITGFCAVYCRYCTRSRMVGNPGGEYRFSTDQWDRALAYIEATPAIRDVLLSGGDPLTVGDDRLDYLLTRLRRIPHVEIVRFSTKVPVVLPQRITPALTRMLKRHHPLFMSLHFMHPDEITPEVRQACGRLADAGIPLGSQTVLLAGVNDSVEVQLRLVRTLLTARVRPYYLYMCDPISGSAHLRTSVAKGLEIMQGLRGHTTGYAVPTFAIDAPGGGGKIALVPDAIAGHDGEHLTLRNFEGKLYRYPDPGKRR